MPVELARYIEIFEQCIGRKAEKILLPLQPGDSLAVARVQSRSFSEKDIIAKATFDARPSQANAQKRAFHDKIDRAFRNVTGRESTGRTDMYVV